MKTIKIKSACLGRYDDVSPFLISDQKLELKVELPEFSGEFYLVAELNGAVETHALTGGDPVTLDHIEAGELHAEVKHYLNGVLIKKYKIEPLILCEVEGNISATPEIIALEREIAVLRRIADGHGQKLEAVENRLSTAEKREKYEIEGIERRVFNLEQGFDPLRG